MVTRMADTLARKLRKEQTNAERRLWRALRNRRLGGHKFRRQQPIGPYIADFVCFEAKLIIELDGDHHDAPERRVHDQVRIAFLEREGFRVIRFWNRELDESFDSVVESIFRAVRA
jgi:very-short-patch-repair endonuclease